MTKLERGINDLQTTNSELAEEWNYDKNGDLNPEDVTANNGKKVWWQCSKGHEWQAKIYHRNNGSGCPICKSERNTSLPEFALVYYLKKYGIEVIHSYKEHGYELDVFIPSKKTAIEFDGYFWHKNKLQKDLEKNQKCVNDDIKLYRIREGLPSLNDTSIDYVIQKDQKQDLSKAIKSIIYEITDLSPDIDLERDSIAIENLREYIEKDNSLLIINPDVAKEWNSEKNGKLKPDFFTANSSKKVWWKCKKGHEWQAVIQSRNKGNGCPYCSGIIAIKGENDLQTVNPSLAEEWNYERNKELTPSDVLPNSDKKVWWKCKNGHEWQAMIGNRQKGQGCPYCSGRKVLKGYNDLQTVNPDLAQEWNYQKNGSLTPFNVTVGSNKKVWWKCCNGHEWQALICHRNKGSGCPFCASKKVLKDYNDLQTINPELTKEWNYQKNGSLTPSDVTVGSNKRVWWKCSMGHEWQATICNRNQGNKCPYCLSKKASTGINDLQTVNPTLSLEWNYEKNNGLTPSDVLPNSEKKVWWKCQKGHEWQAMIGDRNRGNGCPYCSNQKVLKGYNDLQTINPDLANEWNYGRNSDLTPFDVTQGSNKKVWWKCKKGHEWQAVISSRASGNGCPICSGHKVLAGYNDLATLKPELAKQWHPLKNEGLKPEMFPTGSSQKVWWICEKGHEWEAKIAKRSSGQGCPICSGHRILAGYNDLATLKLELSKQWHPDKNEGLQPNMVSTGSSKKVWWICQMGHEWQASIKNRVNGTGCPFCKKTREEK